MSEQAARGRWQNLLSDRDRISNLVFGLACLVAAAYLFQISHDQWFWVDEWDFLASRDLSAPGTLLLDHNGHPSLIPAFLYRVTFAIAGLNHYWPYMVWTIAAHVAAATLLRLLMLRMGVDRWVALAAALVFLFFGAGVTNITWAFQIGFTGSVAFGLAYLVAAVSWERSWRLHAVGIGCAWAAMACSSVGLVLVLAALVAVLVRFGVRLALSHAVVVGAPVGLWYLSSYRRPLEGEQNSASEMLGFSWRMMRDSLAAVGGGPVLALVVLVIALGGLFGLVRVVRQSPEQAPGRSEAAAAVAVAVGFGFLCAVLAFGRASITSGETPDRYVYLGAVFVLPLVGWLARWFARVWVPARAVVLVVLAFSLTVNFRALDDLGPRITGRQHFLQLAASDQLATAPPEMVVLTLIGPHITAGWLSDQVEAGRVPELATPSTPEMEGWARLTLGFAPMLEAPPLSSYDSCREVTEPSRPFPLSAGEMLVGRADQVILVGAEPGTRGARLSFHARALLSAIFDPGPDGENEVRLVAVRDTRVGVATEPAGGEVLVCP